MTAASEKTPVAELLDRLGWSQTRMAREAGIDRGAMHKITGGTLGLGRKRAARIARAAHRGGVDVTPDDLIPPRVKNPREVERRIAAIQRELDRIRADLGL